MAMPQAKSSGHKAKKEN